MDSKIAELITLHICDALDEEQDRNLQQWIEQSEENRLFFEKIKEESLYKQHVEHDKRVDVEKAIQRFDRKTNVSIYRRALRIVSAAACLLLLFSGAYFIWQNSLSKTSTPLLNNEPILLKNKPAVLVLGDGTRLELSTEKLAEINIAGVNATQEKLTYSETISQECQYNTLHIPRGGEYRVYLSDGTVVRLNSGTTFRYPVVFDNNCRRVELDGEAYFYVEASSETPFVVEVGGVQVTAYGTEFNINSHSDQIETALVKGMVGVSVCGSDEEQQLLPSQVAVFDKHTNEITVKDTDVFPYVAWTEGIFVFENKRLEDIMEVLSLWYDIDIVFQQPEIKELHFTGVLKRFETIESILKAILGTVDVDFSCVDNKIMLELVSQQ